MATIRDKVGHSETLPIDLLYAHLDVSFIFNHLDTMELRHTSAETVIQHRLRTPTAVKDYVIFRSIFLQIVKILLTLVRAWSN
jgi:hypothetical protein